MSPNPGTHSFRGRGQDQARDRADRNRDRRVDGVVPGRESAAKGDNPDRGQKRDDEEAIRRARAACGSRVDHEPDEDDAAAPRECPPDRPVVQPLAGIRKARILGLPESRADMEAVIGRVRVLMPSSA